MPIVSQFPKSLGFLSYMPPPTAVTTPTISIAYNNGYTATANWSVPDIAHVSVWVEWNINNGAWQADASRPAGTVTASRAITGGDTVQVRVRLLNSAQVYSDYSTSNSVLSTPEPVTNLASAPGGSPGTTTVTWTNPVSYTGLRLTRTGTGTTATVNPNVGTTSYSDTPGSSFELVYTVVATNAAGDSPARSTTVRTVPKPPTGATLAAVNPGILNFNWTAPSAQFNIAGYDVDLNGSAPTGIGNFVVYQWTGAVHQTVYTSRVRTRDIFGQVSSWASATVTAINDTTPPGCPTPTASWNQGLPGFTVSYGAFTDLQGGSSQLEISFDNGVTVASSLSATAGGGSYNHTIDDSRRGTVIYYRTKATDSLGNVGTSPWVAVTAKPKGTFTVRASQTATWKTAGTDAWRTDTQDVICGFYDYVNAIQYGFWMYGNDIANTCKGYAPDSAKLFLIRIGREGLSGPITVHLHTSTSATGDGYASILPNDYITVSPEMSGTDWSLDYTLPAGFLTKLGNGTAKGLGTRPNPDSKWAPEEVDPWTYRRLRGLNIDNNTGRLTLVFN